MADVQVHDPEPAPPPAATATAPAPARIHTCDQPGCNQSYARIEHLERHVKTHTAPAGYLCKECGKAFARSDVLRRHTKIHSREATVTGDGGGLAKRVSQACQSCAAAKVRCNGGQPCERCSKLSRVCDYETASSDPSTRPHKRVRLQSEDVGQAAPSFEALPNRSTSVSSVHDHVQLPPSSSSTFDLGSSMPMHSFPYPIDDGLDSTHTGMSTFASSSAPAPAAVQHLAAPGSSTAQPSAASPALDNLLNLVFQKQSAGTTTLEDDLSAAFFLPTDDNMFWSQFLQSPAASLPSPARLGSSTSIPPVADLGHPASPPSTASPSYRPRILITAAGLPSRHGSPHPESPTAAADGEGDTARTAAAAAAAAAQGGGGTASEWGLAWQPTGHESGVRLDREASMSILAAPVVLDGRGPTLPTCDEQVRIALLETLRFSQLSDDEYHALYSTLARIPLPVFDLLLSLYFGHFHPLVPLLHVPSFNPKKTLGQLLLILLGIGAVYAPISGALQLGRALVEVARRGIEHLINRDNRLARSLPVAQAQMLWSVMRWTGSARTIELASAFASVHTTMLREQRVFNESQNRSPSDDSPAAQWKAFVANEERRRTAMSCYLLDGEAAVLLRTAPCINSSLLQTLLPCDERLWTAPTAEAWLEVKASVREPVAISVVLKHLSSDSATPLPAVISLSPLAAHVLVQALHLNLLHVHQLRKSGMTNTDLITTHVRRSLSRLARGADEFTPCFNSGGQPDDPAYYAAPRAWYHLAQIATYVPLDELDAVARKSGDGEADTAREYWVKMLNTHTEHARTLALHAGQLLCVLRDYPTHSTHEPASLFYAGLALYLYARSSKPSTDASLAWSEPPSTGSLSSSTSTSKAPASAVQLDAVLDDTASAWVAFGGAAVIASPTMPGSVELAGDEAARTALRAVVKVLDARPVWRVGRTFVAVLQRMLAREESRQGNLHV
ncbi:hypothetical protein JCM3775_000025 [Rhodotorula graminis]